MVPVFKKINKQELKDYRPIFYLKGRFMTVCSGFTENSLISKNQSGFQPGNSCTNYLLSIMHQNNKSFYASHEVRSLFLDMPKAFDKVWHKTLISLTDFLKLRKQTLV